ncbi:MAG TPA: hypothetical protein VLQ79_11835 [Myxococcaceae bacterium]|nr:hypothetical protein [Myxococcaceae bacterium]
MPLRRLVLTAGLLGLAGCAGSLENPDLFGDGGSSLTGFVCSSLGKPAKTEVVLKKCVSGCHSAAVHVSGLDLESSGAAARLVNVSTTACPPRRRVDSVDGGTLQELITQNNPSCTSSMPPGGGLTNGEIACIVEWTRNLAAGGQE